MALEFLTQIRASNTAVAMTSALHFATTLKFLWSPIVDLFGRPSDARKLLLFWVAVYTGSPSNPMFSSMRRRHRPRQPEGLRHIRNDPRTESSKTLGGR